MILFGSVQGRLVELCTRRHELAPQDEIEVDVSPLLYRFVQSVGHFRFRDDDESLDLFTARAIRDLIRMEAMTIDRKQDRWELGLWTRTKNPVKRLAHKQKFLETAKEAATSVEALETYMEYYEKLDELIGELRRSLGMVKMVS